MPLLSLLDYPPSIFPEDLLVSFHLQDFVCRSDFHVIEQQDWRTQYASINSGPICSSRSPKDIWPWSFTNIYRSLAGRSNSIRMGIAALRLVDSAVLSVSLQAKSTQAFESDSCSLVLRNITGSAAESAFHNHFVLTLIIIRPQSTYNFLEGLKRSLAVTCCNFVIQGPQMIVLVPSMELGVQIAMLIYKLFGGSVNPGIPGASANMFAFTGPRGLKVVKWWWTVWCHMHDLLAFPNYPNMKADMRSRVLISCVDMWVSESPNEDLIMSMVCWYTKTLHHISKGKIFWGPLPKIAEVDAYSLAWRSLPTACLRCLAMLVWRLSHWTGARPFERWRGADVEDNWVSERRACRSCNSRQPGRGPPFSWIQDHTPWSEGTGCRWSRRMLPGTVPL